VATTRRHRFVRDQRELDEVLASARQMICPHCHRVGMLIGHGLLMGYAEHSSDRVVRGRRFLCSKRFCRSGCGRTFSMRIASVIANFTVRTCTLSRMLLAVVGGLCLKAAWERNVSSGLALRSGYRLWRRLQLAQSHLRSALCTLGPPPSCSHSQPLAQLAVHLQQTLGSTDCLFAAFQLTLQRPLFG
jgi:hypothetical protein